MIDWHSHVLPGLDDGSRDLAESLELICRLKDQGIRTIAATPHFYADREPVSRFLERRTEAADLLKAALPGESPKLLLGAEVRYYPGIGHMEEMSRLCLEGTDLLLLEMPFETWTEYTLREVVALAGRRCLILAHVERYLNMQRPQTWDRLLERGILMQANASFFLGLGSRHRAVQMLRNGQLHLLGSDAHNLTHRPPYIGKAADVIRKKLGEGFLDQFNELGEALLNKMKQQSI